MEKSQLSNEFKHLKRGVTYQIIKSFRDFDETQHNVCNGIKFLGSNYFPYDAGLTLYFEKEDKEYVIRLQWYKESQSHIIDNLNEYIN